MNKTKWNNLIKKHYDSVKSVLWRENHSEEEISEWWWGMINRAKEDEKRLKDIEDFINGSTHANNNGHFYHPV